MMVGSGLRYAKVQRVRDKNSVDILFVDDGSFVPSVQVMAGAASSNSGSVHLAEPSEKVDDYGIQETKDRDIYALVGFMGNLPIVLGFLFPSTSQMLFAERNLFIDRHPSDWYTVVDDAGNFEAAHPSGTSFVIGASPEHRDLTGEDIDEKWSIARNTDSAPHVCLTVKNAGDQVAKLHISPDGDVLVEHTGDLTVTVGGDAAVTVEGDASLAVTGNLTSSAAAWDHTGPVSIEGNVSVTGNVSTTGNVTAAGTVQGASVVGTTDVSGGGKSLKNHVHGGVTAGAASTAAPT
jgi:hypothetical protein